MSVCCAVQSGEREREKNVCDMFLIATQQQQKDNDLGARASGGKCMEYLTHFDSQSPTNELQFECK